MNRQCKPLYECNQRSWQGAENADQVGERILATGA